MKRDIYTWDIEMGTRHTPQTVQAQLDEDGRGIKLVRESFVTFAKPATFIDPIHGEWTASPKNVIVRQTNHPAKANALRKQNNIVTNSLQEVKDKRAQTNLDRHGHRTGWTEASLSARRKTNLERYGVEEPLSLGHIREKAKAAWTIDAVKKGVLKKYGVDNVSKVPEIKQRQIETSIERGHIRRIEGCSHDEISELYGIPRTTLCSFTRQFGTDLDKIEKFAEQYHAGISDIERIFLAEGLTSAHESIERYRPDFKVADGMFVNADGLYWHSERIKDNKYHFDLRVKMENNDIRILQFRADEIKTKLPIVLSIIKSKTNMTSSIYARKCTIQQVPPKEAKAFLEANHIMGNKSTKNEGLFLDGQLVCLFSYKVIKGILKIERFCSLLNTTVVGGFSRLLKHVEKLTQVKEIHNWVDLRYGDGKHLLNKGFHVERDTLGWCWTNFHATYNRLKCTANMDDRGLSEREHAKELRLSKIYDAGQRLYIKKVGNGED